MFLWESKCEGEEKYPEVRRWERSPFLTNFAQTLWRVPIRFQTSVRFSCGTPVYHSDVAADHYRCQLALCWEQGKSVVCSATARKEWRGFQTN